MSQQKPSQKHLHNENGNHFDNNMTIVNVKITKTTNEIYCFHKCIFFSSSVKLDSSLAVHPIIFSPIFSRPMIFVKYQEDFRMNEVWPIVSENHQRTVALEFQRCTPNVKYPKYIFLITGVVYCANSRVVLTASDLLRLFRSGREEFDEIEKKCV